MDSDNLEAFKQEYRKEKLKKAERHRNSRVYHPIKSTKNSYHRFSNFTGKYWRKGKQLGQDRVDHKPSYYYGDKDIAKYAYSHTSRKQKIVMILVAVFVIAMMVVGAMQ